MPQFYIGRLIQQLEAISKQAQADIDSAPDGSLNVTYVQGCPQFRIRMSDGSTRYLAKSDLSVARRLAQKSYAKQVLAVSTRQIKAATKINEGLSAFDVDSFTKAHSVSSEGIVANRANGSSGYFAGLSIIEAIYDRLPKERQDLVVPYVLPLNEFVLSWEADRIHAPAMFGHGHIFQTEKGEAVRSKSEVIIADKLYRAGVPYKYEQPFETSNGVLYPDFVVLRVSTREELVWEHFGLMDDSDYCNKTIQKLSRYAREGLFPGHGLIATFETSSTPLNIGQIDQIIEMIQGDYVPICKIQGFGK